MGLESGIVLAWLWRRLYGPDQAGTPRRLIYALPQRSLVEQVAEETSKWLKQLGLTEQVALHVVMGGEGKEPVAVAAGHAPVGHRHRHGGQPGLQGAEPGLRYGWNTYSVGLRLLVTNGASNTYSSRRTR